MLDPDVLSEIHSPPPTCVPLSPQELSLLPGGLVGLDSEFVSLGKVGFDFSFTLKQHTSPVLS